MSSQRIKFKSLQLISGLTIVVTLAGLFVHFTNTAEAEWLDGWHYRRKLTLTGMNTITENLSDFPVLVTLNSSRINYNQTQDAGQDIRFTDTNGTILDHEIEKWDETATSTVWVKAPTLTQSNTGQYIYVYYGNPSASDGQNAQGVWDSNYKGVWHLTDLADSTANANTLSSFGSIATTAGKVALAYNFDGTDDYLETTSNVNNLPTTAVTVEVWQNVTENRNQSTFQLNTDVTTDRIQAHAPWSDGTVYWDFGDTSTTGRLSYAPSGILGNWTYYAFTSQSGVGQKIYRDGNTTPAASDANHDDYSGTARKFTLGRNNGGLSYYKGIIDEVRVSNTVRSAEWIEATYLAQTDTMLTYNAEEFALDPIAHWTFDDPINATTTAVYDESTNNHDGLVKNGATWTNAGKFSGALSLDGTDDYVEVADSAALDFVDLDDLTISGWFYRDTATTDDVVLAKRNGIVNTDTGYILYLDDSTDKLTFELSDATDEYQLESSTTFTATGWNHFEIIWDQDSAANSEIYINGKADSATDTGTIANVGDFANALTLAIGAESDAGNPFDGQLDDIKIYRYARSAAEVHNDYNRGLAVRLGDAPEYSGNAAVGWWNFDAGDTDDRASGLVGCWRLNEGTSTVANDCSGSANTGTVVSGTSWVNGIKGNIGLGQTSSALDLNGSTQWVSISDNATLDFSRNVSPKNDITLIGWLSRDTEAAVHVILAKTNDYTSSLAGYSLVINNGNPDKLVFRIGDGTNSYTLTSATTIATATWYHFAVVWDNTAGNSEIYINGIADAATDGGSFSVTGDASNALGLRLGSESDNGLPFDGKLDDLKIYKKALSPSDIYADYLSGRAKDKGVSSTAPNLANNNDGQLNGPTWRRASDCKVGKCLEFDGTDDYVSMPANAAYNFNQSDDFSVSAWAKTDVLTSQRDIIEKHEDISNEFCYALYLNADNPGKFAFSVCKQNAASTVVTATTAASAGIWYHVVGVSDGTNISLYVDGVKVAGPTAIGFSGATQSVASVNIGKQYNGALYWDGLIDDVRIYDYALSQKQIMQIYNRAKPVAQYKFDEGAGVTAYDESDYNNDGTLTNFPTDGTNWVTGKFGKALEFDGADDIITVTDSASVDIGQQLTATGWFKVDDTADIRAFVEKDNEYLVRINGDDTLHFYIHDGVDWEPNLIAATTPAAGVWNHFTAIWDDVGDANSMKIYLNGKLDAQQTRAAAAPTGTTNNLILGNRAGATDDFDGALDNISIYNYALTEAEILRDYNGGLAAGFGQ